MNTFVRLTCRTVLLAGLCCVNACAPAPAQPAASGEPVTLTVFAAASLTEPLEVVAGAWTEATKNQVQFNFASSGDLARQIIAAAPADLFISANKEWMDALVEKDLVDATTVARFAKNRLVVIAPEDSTATLGRFEDIVAFADAGIAIGDPEHVPAGMYAKQAFENAGIWTALENRALRALDVRAALAYVQHKEAAVGIVYATDAHIVPGVKVILEIPQTLYDPVYYYAAPVAGGRTATATEFLTFVMKPANFMVFKQLGFELP